VNVTDSEPFNPTLAVSLPVHVPIRSDSLSTLELFARLISELGEVGLGFPHFSTPQPTQLTAIRAITTFLRNILFSIYGLMVNVPI
jgi:hypothetical protein